MRVSSLPSFVLSGVHILFILFVFIYVYWCPILFPCQKIFVSFSSNTMGVANGAGTKTPSEAHAFTQFFVGFRVAQS